MKVEFKYDRTKDIECLLRVGAGSHNSKFPTPEYKLLISEMGENPNEESANVFIEKYLETNNINIQDYIDSFQKDFDLIADEFAKRAEKVFGVKLNKITAYLTINRRLPYNLNGKYFFVHISLDGSHQRHTIMHELWHFYTWDKFGETWLKKIGFEKYNDIKESLTILLNVLCEDLMSESKNDKGYPQHEQLREYIKRLWQENQDIDYIWNQSVLFLSN